MRRLLALFLLTACSSSTTSNDGGSDASPANDASMTPDGGSIDSGSMDGGGDLYCPSNATLVPYLSQTRTTSFAMPQMVLQTGRDYFGVLETDVGRIVLALTAKETPITVNSFVFLALNHFYDGVAFHRVIGGFVAQGGDPNSVDKPSNTWGTGGCGYTFNTELVMTLNFDARGVLGMARSQSMSSNGSQFFITLAPTPNLDQMYTVFGKVVEGDAVLDMIKKGDQNINGGLVANNPTRMTNVHVCIAKQ